MNSDAAFDAWYAAQRHQLTNEQVCRLIWNRAWQTACEALSAAGSAENAGRVVAESNFPDTNGWARRQFVGANSTPATSDAKDAARYRWLRDIRCNNLTVSYNDQAACYITAQQRIESQPEWFSDDTPESRAAMSAANSIWTVQIYPDTPVGFNAYNGATLDAAIDRAIVAEGSNDGGG